MSRRLNTLFSILLILAVTFAVVPPALAGAPEKDNPKYEIHFLETMIDQQALGVIEAESCATKSVHAVLRRLCSTIAASQNQEIQTMKTWLRTWYGIKYTQHIKSRDMDEARRLSHLNHHKFERLFLKLMIPQDVQSVQKAEQCQTLAHHSELASLCQSIAATQRGQITTMQNWLCKWDGICKYYLK